MEGVRGRTVGYGEPIAVNRLRLWILGTALGSFAAGMNVGLVAPRLFAAEDHRVVAADEAYARSIAADYGLTRGQEASLRMVLQQWREEEISAFRTAETSMLPPAIQTKLLVARGKVEQRIRAVLDEDQRARYDLATRPQGPK